MSKAVGGIVPDHRPPISLMENLNLNQEMKNVSSRADVLVPSPDIFGEQNDKRSPPGLHSGLTITKPLSAVKLASALPVTTRSEVRNTQAAADFSAYLTNWPFAHFDYETLFNSP